MSTDHLAKELAGLHVATSSLDEEQQQENAWQLDQLPDDVVLSIALGMPDPAALACACRRTAALLSHDALMLQWACIYQPASTPSAQYRHPGYALLHWRRVRHMSTGQLAALVLRQSSQHTAAGQPLPDSKALAQHLDAGNASVALQALLPHSRQLLLLYAAQAGQMPLLAELLATGGVLAPIRLRVDDFAVVESSLLDMAAHAAAHHGHADALQALLVAMCSDISLRLLDALLVGAARGGSAACVTQLLKLRSVHAAAAGIEYNSAARISCRLLAGAASSGSYEVVALLAAMAAEWQPSRDVDPQQHQQYRAAYKVALQHGHLDMLPLLAAHTCDEAAAVDTCAAANMAVDDAALAALVPLLQAAMLQLANHDNALEHRRYALQALYKHGSIATLNATMAAFDARALQNQLASCMLSTLAQMPVLPSSHVVQWVLQHALPVIRSTADGAAEFSNAARHALGHGHMELLRALMPDAATALSSTDAGWRAAELRGQLLHAVQRGDAAAVQRAWQPLQQAAVLEADIVHTSFWNEALMQMAALADPEAAEAVARALGPCLDDEAGRLVPHVLCAHGGRLLPVLYETAPALGRRLVGPTSEHLFCSAALRQGEVAAAEWLVCHLSQRPNYLSEAGYSITTKTQDDKLMGSYTQLLHRLAARRQSITGGSGGGDGASSVSSEEAGRQGAPAGAQQLSHHFLGTFLAAGVPDLLHGLLVFLECWRPESFQPS